MKKLLFIFIMLPGLCFGQSKKEQIVDLKKLIDSLNIVLETTKENGVKETRELNTTIEVLNKEIAVLKERRKFLENLNNKTTKEIERLLIELAEISKKNLELQTRVKAFEEEIYSSQKSFTSITDNLHNWNGNGYKISLNDNRISDDVQYIGVLKTLNDAVFFINGKEIKFGSWQVKNAGSIVEMKFISSDYTIIMEYDEDFRTGAYTEGSINLAFDGIVQLKTNFVMEGWGF
ncbi:hypothetical protein N9I21_04090 [Crocinitomicaceae bacterium]|nr:hypothetical protein [Crocinitomicaceae bacterium]MDC1203486.1 hypothetical protein [Crocinitomicaceae bacterium]